MHQMRTLNCLSFPATVAAAIVAAVCLLAQPAAGQNQPERNGSKQKPAASSQPTTATQQPQSTLSEAAGRHSAADTQRNRTSPGGEPSSPQARNNTPPPANAAAAKQRNAKKPALDDQLLRSLESVMKLDEIRPEGAGTAGQPSPLLLIGKQMKVVERRLEETDCGPDTQKVQEQIVKALDELIKRAQQGGGPCPACGGAG